MADKSRSTFLRIRELAEGMHSGERIIAIRQADGTDVETLASTRSIHGSKIDIGSPVAARGDGALLVELPQETSNGYWRIWVSPDELAVRAA